MFNDENHLKTIATHTAYGGHLIAKEVAKRENVFINIGPRLLDFWKPEGIRQSARNNRFYGMGAEYYKAGVRNLSINTDAGGEGLAFQATMSARLGLDELVAMEAITINSARALGIDDRVGSLEVGKDADIVIKRSSLLDVTTPVDLVLINGRIIYQRNGVNLVAKQRQDSI
jgi:imidazolonepropionase-like amidohydrolase